MSGGSDGGALGLDCLEEYVGKFGSWLLVYFVTIVGVVVQMTRFVLVLSIIMIMIRILTLRKIGSYLVSPRKLPIMDSTA